jgi:hypothetical protein
MSIELINTTGYSAFGFEHVLFKERPYYIVIVKQSWQLMRGGGMRPLDEPRPVRVGDHFQGRPDFSAIDLPTDLIPYKPHGEIVVCGHARTATAQASWDVKLSVGGWSKSLRAFGRRTWRKGLMGWTLSEPAATRQARLDYAAAYGGHFELPPSAPNEEPLVVAHTANPGGTGWLGKGHDKALTKQQTQALSALETPAEVLAPNLELAAWLPQQDPPGRDTKPLAFGALPAWSPQRQAYLKSLKPPKPSDPPQRGYPDSFDMDHWQQTLADQWLPKNQLAGTALHLSGIFEEGDASYRLPQAQALLYVRSQSALNSTLQTDIDTLILDCDARVLEVVERRLVSLELLGPDLVIEVLQRAH